MELAWDKNLPLDVRRKAVVIARHFPTVEDISSMSLTQHPVCLGPMLASPDETEVGRFGPLRYSTRLVWPEEG